MNVSLYVVPGFDQINDQFQKHGCNPIECTLGADAGPGMKPAEFRPEIPVIVAKGRKGNGTEFICDMGSAVLLSIDDLAVRGENKSFIAWVRGQNASMEGERSVLELM